MYSIVAGAFDSHRSTSVWALLNQLRTSVPACVAANQRKEKKEREMRNFRSLIKTLSFTFIYQLYQETHLKCCCICNCGFCSNSWLENSLSWILTIPSHLVLPKDQVKYWPRVIFFFFCNIVDINLGFFLARKKVCYTTVNFHDQHADLHEFWVWGVELISLKSWDLVL